MDPKPIHSDDLELDLPVPKSPLVEDFGPPVSWAAWMAETAPETIRYLERYGHELPPPPPDVVFRLD